jgi:hypothetical protein
MFWISLWYNCENSAINQLREIITRNIRKKQKLREQEGSFAHLISGKPLFLARTASKMRTKSAKLALGWVTPMRKRIIPFESGIGAQPVPS